MVNLALLFGLVTDIEESCREYPQSLLNCLEKPLGQIERHLGYLYNNSVFIILKLIGPVYHGSR
jgi:hypothetical protein